ncbi:alpha/beta fold hydrolase [Janibacter sp. CX7]|uniref:alpha/beta hydrolase family protein n=1 Tax=Janibacter sp. CX7 TaxID=2963431 RepID=UPI0020CD3A35|nr:alpha/beta hydrolase [Janibacter sp. CX7]UTT65184.1 alpha/beta fold hydrolase [Janibacter sp. CX7]
MDQHSQISLPGGGTTTLHAAGTDATSAPFVLVMPAMGVPAGYYGPFVDELARHGVAAGVADYTGQGDATPHVGRGRDLGYDDLAHGWLPAVVDRVREQHDGPVVALGHSLGGHLLAAHLAGPTPAVDAAVLIGSGTPHWRAQQGLKTLAQTQLIAVVSRLCGYWPGVRLGFGGTQARTLMREWAAFSRTGRLAPGGRDIAAGLAGRSLPLLAVDLDNDTLAPPAAVDELVGLFASADVERFTFAKAVGDPGKPVNHYSFARSPEMIGERIAAWVTGRVGERARP